MSSKDKTEEVQQIELHKLSLQNLTQFKQQLDKELSVFHDSLQTLKMAQTKYSDSRDCLEKIKSDACGTSIMVPLTGSIYVPGTIADTEKVLIDVGTGYYLNMNIESAKDYFKRKVTFVTDRMENIQGIGLEKNKIREAIIDVIDGKIKSQLASQKAVQNATAKT